MSSDWYHTLSIETLQDLAKRESVRHIEKHTQEELIEILEDIQEEKALNLNQSNDIMRLKSKKYNIIHQNHLIPTTDPEFKIPEQYADTTITLLLRDPFWAFAYWDVNLLEFSKIKDHHKAVALHLRVSELADSTIPLKDAISRFEIPIQDTDMSWYINLPNPGSWYEVELVCTCKDHQNSLAMAKSNRIESPGGYWLEHVEELKHDKDQFELFLAGHTDPSGVMADNALIEKIIAGTMNRK